jgi:S1-C subfamily serine protease
MRSSPRASVSRASSWCSPAERAGLRAVDFYTVALGDVIVAVNDKTVRRLSDLTDELERNGVGKRVAGLRRNHP